MKPTLTYLTLMIAALSLVGCNKMDFDEHASKMTAMAEGNPPDWDAPIPINPTPTTVVQVPTPTPAPTTTTQAEVVVQPTPAPTTTTVTPTTTTIAVVIQPTPTPGPITIVDPQPSPTPIPAPSRNSGTCTSGQALTSCMSCTPPPAPVVAPWAPSNKAEKLAQIQFLSCGIANKSDSFYGTKLNPSHEDVLTKIQACSAQLYPETALTSFEQSTIDQLLGSNNSMRQRFYGGLWYQPPYTDHFEKYFGLDSVEARRLFCYNEDPQSVLSGLLVTSEYAKCIYRDDCSGYNSVAGQKRFAQTQAIRQQLKDCMGKSVQLPPVEAPKPYAPVCDYKSFEGFWILGGASDLSDMLSQGYSVSIEYNNSCAMVNSTNVNFAGNVKMVGYKCQ